MPLEWSPVGELNSELRTQNSELRQSVIWPSQKIQINHIINQTVLPRWRSLGYHLIPPWYTKTRERACFSNYIDVVRREALQIIFEGIGFSMAAGWYMIWYSDHLANHLDGVATCWEAQSDDSYINYVSVCVPVLHKVVVYSTNRCLICTIALPFIPINFDWRSLWTDCIHL